MVGGCGWWLWLVVGGCGCGCGFPSMCDYQGDQEKDYYALEEKYFYHIFHQGGKNTLLSTNKGIPTPKTHFQILILIKKFIKELYKKYKHLVLEGETRK